MPRTAGSKNSERNNSKPPELQYEQLKPIDKYICFQFYLNKRSKGSKGWNCDPSKKPACGSVHHYRSSQSVIDCLSIDQFRHRAKVSVLGPMGAVSLATPVLSPSTMTLSGFSADDLSNTILTANYLYFQSMVTLAEKLQNQGIEILPPPLPNPAPLTPTPSTPTPSTPTPSTPDSCVSNSEVQVYTSPKMPKSILKTPTPKKQQYAEDSTDLEEIFNEMALSTDKPCSLQTVKGVLGCPYISGRWEEYDHSNDVMRGYIVFRMLLHGGIGDEDLQFAWVDPYHFKIRLRWPGFMSSCLSSVGLDMSLKDKNGQPMERFPSNHPLYNSLAQNTKALKDKNGEIWNEGIFAFNKPMSTEHIDSNVFDVKADRDVCVFQLVFTEKVDTPKKNAQTVSITKSSFKFTSRKSIAIDPLLVPLPESPPVQRGRSPTRNPSPRGQTSSRKRAATGTAKTEKEMEHLTNSLFLPDDQLEDSMVAAAMDLDDDPDL